MNIRTEPEQTGTRSSPELDVERNTWREAVLEDLATEMTVGYVGPMASEYVSEGIPFLRSQNVDYLRINRDDLKYITPRFHERLRKSSLSPGDVVIVRTGKPGACAVIPDWLPVANCSDLVIVRCGDNLDPHFLAYYVNSLASHHVAAHLVGAVQQHFNVGSARTIRLKLPPIDEQLAIAHTLGALDDKIDLNQQMNKTLEAICKAFFERWFIDFEFPNEEGKPYRSSGGEMVRTEFGKIPKGWEHDRLGNHSIIKGRIGWKGLQVSEYVDEGPSIVGGTQLINNRIDWDDCPRVTQERYDESPEIMLKESDILMTKDGTIGKLAFIDELREPATVASGIFVVRSNSATINQMYLWNYFKSDSFKSLVETRIEGSVVPHLYQRDITDLKIVVPSLRVASQFESITRIIQQKTASTSESSLGLKRIRDSLLPKLMSGKIRVPVEVR